MNPINATTINEKYVECISHLITQRRQTNPHYSIRALARDLHMDPSDLINIMKKRKNVSARVAYRIGLTLKLKDTSLLEFVIPALS